MARSGEARERRLALLAAADEELGGAEGTAWWLKHRPDLFAGVRGALAEGGHNRVGIERTLAWWGIEVAQKRPLWLEACAAEPEVLVRGLARTIARPLTWRVDEPVRAFFGALEEIAQRRGGRAFDPDLSIAPHGPTVRLFPGMENFFLDSLQVNQFLTRESETCAAIDARLLPATDERAFLAETQRALGPAVGLRVLLVASPAPPSPLDDPLYRILALHLGGEAPAVPYFIAGITDARFLRARGIPVYGFSPFLLDGAHLRAVHGSDERIPVSELDAGAARMTAVVRSWLARPGAADEGALPAPATPTR